MERALKNEFAEQFSLTLSSSVLDYAPKFSSRTQTFTYSAFFSNLLVIS